MAKRVALVALALWLGAGMATAEDQTAPTGDAAEAALDDRSTWDAERWIAEVDARPASLPGLRYSAQRTTERGELSVEERWRFVLFGGDKFRIDYFGDTARQVSCDGRFLVDYIPAMDRAVRWDLDALDPAERASMLGKVLQKIGVPGLRLGQAEGVAWTLSRDRLDGREVVRLVGEGADKTTLTYVIDAEHLGVHHIRIVQDGQTVLDARPSDHREIAAGVTVPHRVELESPDKGGLAKISVRLTKVTALSDSPDDLFSSTLDASIPIEERP